MKKQLFVRQMITFSRKNIVGNTFVMYVVALFIFMAVTTYAWWGDMFMALSGAAFGCGLSILAIQRRAEKQYDGLKFLQQEQYFCLNEEKIRRDTVNGHQSWGWKEIDKIVETKECFQFHLTEGQFMIVPKHFFDEQEHITDIQTLLEQQFTRQKKDRWAKK